MILWQGFLFLQCILPSTKDKAVSLPLLQLSAIHFLKESSTLI